MNRPTKRDVIELGLWLIVTVVVLGLCSIASGADWQSQTVNVVRVLAGDNGGSGALVCVDPATRDGWVLTAKHVVEGSQSATVTWPDGYVSQGRVVGTGKLNDTALIQVRAPDASFIPVASEPAKAGAEVVALGYGGQQGPIRNLKLISWRSKLHGYKPQLNDYVQLDPYARSGDSGGPILDGQGKLVGIVTGGELAGPNGPMTDSHGPWAGPILLLMHETVPHATYQRYYPCPPGVPCGPEYSPIAPPMPAQIIQSPVQQGPRRIVQVPPRSPVQKPDPVPPDTELPPPQEGAPPGTTGPAVTGCSEAIAELVKSQQALNESIQALVAKPAVPGPPGPPGEPGPQGDQGPQGERAAMSDIIAIIKTDPEIAALLEAGSKPIDYAAVAARIAPLLPPINFRQLRADPNGTIEQDGVRFKDLGVESVRLGGELVFRGFPRSAK